MKYDLKGTVKFSVVLHDFCQEQTAQSYLPFHPSLPVVFNILVMGLGYIIHHFSTQFPGRHISTSTYITFIKLLIQLYPQSLQDTWFIENRNINEFSFPPEMKKFLREQYRECDNPLHLNVICRTKIFQQLGYNPIPKAEKLPLPRCLINFVQFQDVEDLYNYVTCHHRL